MNRPPAAGDKAETARYIAAMAVEMRRLASACGLELLAHILDMAAEEAQDNAAQGTRDLARGC